MRGFYSSTEGVIVPFVQKFYKQMIVAVAAIFIASMAAMTLNASAAPKDKPVSGPGKVVVDTDVNAGINYGTGIDNGEWVTADRLGIQIGLRATDRTDGLLDVNVNTNNHVGVYDASTGTEISETLGPLAEWNYEWTVDLSRAKGVAAGTTLSDYTLTLEQDFIVGFDGDIPLLMPGYCANVINTETLCQQSWNPVFGNGSFNKDAEDTYNFRLVLTPVSFSGPSIAVSIQVNVTDPASTE